MFDAQDKEPSSEMNYTDTGGKTLLLLPLLIDPEFTALPDKFTAHSSAPVEFLCHAVICFVPAVETMQERALYCP